jgi:hypothetical protein
LKAIVGGLKEGLDEATVTIVTRLWVLGHVIGVLLLLKWVWPECPGYGFVVGSLTAVVVALAEIEVLSRATGRGPAYFDTRERATWIGVAGFTLAYVFAVVLLAGELNDRRRAEESQRRRESERREYDAKLNSPEVKAGMEAMERARALRERPAGEKPGAASRPTR